MVSSTINALTFRIKRSAVTDGSHISSMDKGVVKGKSAKSHARIGIFLRGIIYGTHLARSTVREINSEVFKPDEVSDEFSTWDPRGTHVGPYVGPYVGHYVLPYDSHTR